MKNNWAHAFIGKYHISSDWIIFYNSVFHSLQIFLYFQIACLFSDLRENYRKLLVCVPGSLLSWFTEHL